MIGVPTAPKVTAETSAIRARQTAAIAGKPSAISRGAATVAGVPNPAAPSMKHTSSHPTNSIWMRLSGVTRSTSSRMRASAPLARITPRKARAPRTIRTTDPAMINPSITDADICRAGTPHATIASAIVITSAMGMAREAGMRSTTSRIATDSTGMSAAIHWAMVIGVLRSGYRAHGIGGAVRSAPWRGGRHPVPPRAGPGRAVRNAGRE